MFGVYRGWRLHVKLIGGSFREDRMQQYTHNQKERRKWVKRASTGGIRLSFSDVESEMALSWSISCQTTSFVRWYLCEISRKAPFE